MKIRLTETELISLIRQTIKEQDRKCKKGGGYGCHGTSSTMTGVGIKKRGSRLGTDDTGSGDGTYEDTISGGSSFGEISNFSSYDDNDRESIISSYGNDKLSLPAEVQPPSKKNKMDYYTAAWRDASRFNIKNSNVEYTKFFDASGNFKNPEDRLKFRGADIYFPFYKHYFPNKTKITPLDVINLYKNNLGGLDKFVTIASTGYEIK
jgi:hypothetical protein